MGSPLVIRDAPAAAVIGGGFIGAGARRGPAADRRRGRGAARLLARAGLGRGRPPGHPAGLSRPGRAAGRRPGGGRPHRLAQRRTTSSRPGGCWSRAVTWSARSRWRPPRRRPRPCARWPSSRPSQAAAVNYNIRYYPALPRDPRPDRRGGARAGPERHRVVRPGLAALPRRLQLAGRGGRPDEPPRRGRHRHALDGPGPVPGRPADPLGQRRPGHVPPPTAQAHRADRHLHRLGRPPASRQAREVEVTTDDHAAVLLRFDGGRPGRLPRLAGHRRPQEPPDDRDRGHRGVGLPGTASRPTGSGSARARGPNQLLRARSRPCSARPPPRWPTIPAATSRASRIRSSSSTSTSMAGSSKAGRPAGPPSFPTFADGDREVRLCEAIARSAADGRWASVE